MQLMGTGAHGNGGQTATGRAGLVTRRGDGSATILGHCLEGGNALATGKNEGRATARPAQVRRASSIVNREFAQL